MQCHLQRANLSEEKLMYQVYLAFGYHNIYDYTDEQFEGAKKFYKLFQLKDNLWGNKRGDIFAWRKE